MSGLETIGGRAARLVPAVSCDNIRLHGGKKQINYIPTTKVQI
jgi:hypothetical protein